MRRYVLLLSVLAACGGGGGDDPDANVLIPDAASGIDADPDNPMTLADTGLCVDASCEQIAEGIFEFEPEYILWSDGATKRRWIYLPPGSQIDTTDMDFWQFPVGTKLWKEFTRDGTRVETRLIQRTGPGVNDFLYASFEWNAAQNAATLWNYTDGVVDALGTPHNIPTRTECRQCHDRQPARILGFSAILLDHAESSEPAMLTLDDLVQGDLLTNPPVNTGLEYFPLPGTATDQAALGYLHTNCGNCHNPESPVLNQVPVVWRLTVGSLATVQGTPAYTTAVDVAPTLTNVPGDPTAIIEPHDTAHSAAYLRMSSTDSLIMMPKIGHELVDDTGLATLAAWIASL
jgi:hypothetical protein